MIIVSLTSYKERLPFVPRVIDSILNNTMLPDKICLTLYTDDIQYVTNNLQEYFTKHNIEIIEADKDIKPHTKYFYVMQKYREACIITIDDDIVYPKDLIKTLSDSYKKYPNCISASRCHYIKRDKNNTPLIYKNWEHECKRYNTPQSDLFTTGCGGVLYPPNILQISDDDLETINNCLTADDIWLHWKAKQLDIKTVWAKNSFKLNWIQGTQWLPTALHIGNTINHGNDEYLKRFHL